MSKPSVDEFFDSMAIKRYLGPFERWIKEDPERAEKFWAVLEEAEKRGLSLQAVIDHWNETESPIPVQRAQVHRRWRDRQNSR